MAIPGVARLLEHQLKRACDIAGVKVEDAIGRSRKQELVLARQLYCYLARLNTNASLAKIGYFINRDHVSVLHSLNKAKWYLEVKDPLMMKIFNRL